MVVDLQFLSFTFDLTPQIFELVAGQPPFDNFFKDKEALLRQIIESVGKVPDKCKRVAALPQTEGI